MTGVEKAGRVPSFLNCVLAPCVSEGNGICSVPTQAVAKANLEEEVEPYPFFSVRPSLDNARFMRVRS